MLPWPSRPSGSFPRFLTGSSLACSVRLISAKTSAMMRFMLALLYFGTRGGQAGHGFCRRAPWKLWRLAFLASELGLGAPHCKTCVRLLRRASRARCVPMGLARASQAYSGCTSRAQPCRRRKPGLRFAPAALCAHLRLFARLAHAVKRALRAAVLGDKCIFLLPHVAGHALPRLHHRPVTLETFFYSVECAKCRRECDLSGVRATLCGDRACRVRENAGESAIRRLRAQPSAEIVRVECAKCRRECDFAGCARNPLRRSGVSSARNAGESAICRLCTQPSAEITRVECAKCRRECDWPAARATLCGDRACRVRENAGESAIRRVSRATLCGDRACRVREIQARVRFSPCCLVSQKRGRRHQGGALTIT